jgi:hypothetical protein
VDTIPEKYRMKEVVIFTEGIGELIFIRELLIRVIDNNDLSFDCIDLRDYWRLSIPYTFDNPLAKIHFQIINVGNDERVLSEIVNNSPRLIENEMEIIGIRDMFSEQYKKYSDQINIDTIDDFKASTDSVIQQLDGYERIHFFFAIMEVEAWFLSMYKIFERINASLTVENIKNKLNYDLENNDPEKTYFHPAVQLTKILQLVGINYGKHQDDYNRLVRIITAEDVQNTVEKNFCNSFIQLLGEIMRMHADSLI